MLGRLNRCIHIYFFFILSVRQKLKKCLLLIKRLINTVNASLKSLSVFSAFQYEEIHIKLQLHSYAIILMLQAFKYEFLLKKFLSDLFLENNFR